MMIGQNCGTFTNSQFFDECCFFIQTLNSKNHAYECQIGLSFCRVYIYAKGWSVIDFGDWHQSWIHSMIHGIYFLIPNSCFKNFCMEVE